MFSNLIDCVIIGNAYASDEELATVARLAKMRTVPIRVELSSSISDLEKEIVLGSPHIYRGEVSSYVYRTKSDSRKKYSSLSIPPKNNIEIKKGDILVDNDLYLQYKGELQIAKKGRAQNEKVNVVGKIHPDDFLLLDSLEPWSSFHFEEAL
jgi:hypothetical protein